MEKHKEHSKDSPPKPREVCRKGVLYHTTSYMWVDPESRLSQIFKSGWVEWRHMNYAHPLMVKELSLIKMAQEKIRKSMEIDWSKLEGTYFTI